MDKLTYCYLLKDWVKEKIWCDVCNLCKERMEEIKRNDKLIEKCLNIKFREEAKK